MRQWRADTGVVVRCERCRLPRGEEVRRVHLPTGTVTFLFTDIDGSTHLLQQLGDRYAEVQRAHQQMLRAAFAAHDGHEVDTQGDSFFVAFAAAPAALAAAAD